MRLMHDRRRLLVSAGQAAACVAICIVALSAAIAAAREPTANAPAIDDVPAAIDRASSRARAVEFDGNNTTLPPGGHLQGIQMVRTQRGGPQLVLLSHDSTTVGYLLIVELPDDPTTTGRVVSRLTFPSDGRLPPLRHAGGIQVADNVLVVGLEDNQQKTRSEVQFWNVADPANPKRYPHLTIHRAGKPKDQTAGGVGIVGRDHDYLVAVANWDSRAIDFYLSNGQPLASEACRFELASRWQVEGADTRDWRPDKEFAPYQAINLVADALDNIYLIGTGMAGGKNVVDLFAVDLDQPTPGQLRKVLRKVMTLPTGNRLQYGGGVSWDGNRPVILSSPRNVSRRTRIGLAR